MSSREVVNALRGVRSAEIQAIAIYRAECFWIRKAERQNLLNEILTEELAHDGEMAKWVEIGAVERAFSIVGGALLGTFLALLPWRWMCWVQSVAEIAAADIYARAAERVRVLPIDSSELMEVLGHAESSERSHAARFKNRPPA